VQISSTAIGCSFGQAGMLLIYAVSVNREPSMNNAPQRPSFKGLILNTVNHFFNRYPRTSLRRDAENPAGIGAESCDQWLILLWVNSCREHQLVIERAKPDRNE
jgi:hypothetical protein